MSASQVVPNSAPNISHNDDWSLICSKTPAFYVNARIWHARLTRIAAAWQLKALHLDRHTRATGTMFPVFLAGAAVLEIRRALHRPPGDPDVEAMRKREAELKAALEVPVSSAQHNALQWRSSVPIDVVPLPVQQPESVLSIIPVSRRTDHRGGNGLCMGPGVLRWHASVCATSARLLRRRLCSGSSSQRGISVSAPRR